METLRELVTIGKQHFEKREFAKAEHYFRKVVQQNATYADVYHMLGVIHHADGRFAAAIDCFQKALKINPHYAEATLNLSVLYNDLGRYKDAKKLYTQLQKEPERAGKKDNETPKIEPVLKGKLANMHSEVGDIYRGLGLYPQAADEYRKALALHEQYVDIRTKLGIALREGGALPESVTELRRACKDNGKYTLANVQLGVTYYALGKMHEAKKEWNAVLDKDPQNALAKMYLRLCETQGKA